MNPIRLLCTVSAFGAILFPIQPFAAVVPPHTAPIQIQIKLPEKVYEGIGTVRAAATVALSDLLDKPVAILLISSDPSRLRVPSEVVIPPWTQSVSFNFEMPDDDLQNGSTTVLVEGFAEGLLPGVASCRVLDNDPFKLEIARVPNPQFVQSQIALHAQALDTEGAVIATFNATAVATARDPAGQVLLTNLPVSFRRGLLTTGPIFTSPMQGVRIGITLPNGVSGLSNPFDVEDYQVRSLPYRVVDAAYDATRSRFYIITDATDSNLPAQLVVINPQTGLPISTELAGDKPTQLALSASDRWLYVVVQNGAAFQRLDLDSGEWQPRVTPPTPIISLLPSSTNPAQLAVVHRTDSGSETVLYENDIPKPIKGGAGRAIAFSDDGEYLFDLFTGSSATKYQAGPDGLTPVQSVSQLPYPGLSLSIRQRGGLIYGANGAIIDSQQLELLNEMPRFNPTQGSVPVPDPERNRVHFIVPFYILTFDRFGVSLLGSARVPELRGDPIGAIRYGANSLAIWTSEKHLLLLDISLVGQPTRADLALEHNVQARTIRMSESVEWALRITNKGPEPVREPKLSLLSARHLPFDHNGILTNRLTVTLEPLQPGATTNMHVRLAPTSIGPLTARATITGLEFDPDSSNNEAKIELVASTPSGAPTWTMTPLLLNHLQLGPSPGILLGTVSTGPFRDSVVALNPATLQIQETYPVGPEPTVMATTPESTLMHVAIQNGRAILGYDLAARKQLYEYPLDPGAVVADLKTVPGHPASLLVTLQNVSTNILLLEQGVLKASFSHYTGQIVVGNNSNQFYIAKCDSSYTAFSSFAINAGQISHLLTTEHLLTRRGTTDGHITFSAVSRPQLHLEQNRVFTPNGLTIDPETHQVIHSQNGFVWQGVGESSLVQPDLPLRRVHFLHETSRWSGQWVFETFDADTDMLLRTQQIPGLSLPHQMIRFAPGHYAIRSAAGLFIGSGFEPTRPLPDLRVTITVPRPPVLHRPFEVQLRASNTASTPASAARLQYSIPEFADLVAVDTTEGQWWIHEGKLYVGRRELPGAASWTVALQLRPKAVTAVAHTAIVGSHEADSNPQDNFATLATPVHFTGAKNQLEWIPFTANDAAYNPVNRKFYLAAPKTSSVAPNHIVEIDSPTGALERTFSAGTLTTSDDDPPARDGRLSVSASGAFLYAIAESGARIARFDLKTGARDQFVDVTENSLNPWRAFHIQAHPELDDTLVMILRQGFGSGQSKLVLYVNGQKRFEMSDRELNLIHFEFERPNQLFAFGAPSRFARVDINPKALSLQEPIGDVPPTSEFGSALLHDHLLDNAGRVWNLETKERVGLLELLEHESVPLDPGQWPNPRGVVLPDTKLDRVYLLKSDQIATFSASTFKWLGSFRLPAQTGRVLQFLRWGDDGLAFLDYHGLHVLRAETFDFAELSTDADQDGIADYWEKKFGWDPNNPKDALQDADQDGQSNLSEVLAGTDPRNPSDRLMIQRLTLHGEQAEAAFTRVPGKSYRLEASDYLNRRHWILLETRETPDGLQWPLDAAPSSRFFRLRVTSP